jgi:hypothetical protein
VLTLRVKKYSFISISFLFLLFLWIEEMEPSSMRHTLIAVVIVLVTLQLFGSSVSAQHGHRHDIKGYRIGQNVTFECMEEGRWVPGPYVSQSSI